MSNDILRFNTLLTNWYNKYKRDLPWRDTRDPYIIWISEVILQQTRVVQGRSYFDRFIQYFPDVKTLAEASEDEVLNLWQGLGYYSRARNLHAAAKSIIENHSGMFPTQYKDILALKGVGEYTAAAIASFSYDLPYATVDGNVYRVLSRIFGVNAPIDTAMGKKLFAELAQEILNPKNPAMHNQALMELGALQCVPVSPNCIQCPMMDLCVAYGQNNVSDYPVKVGKVKVRNRYFNYLNILCGDEILLRKREAGDIWQGLYEFPLIETEKELNLEQLIKSKGYGDTLQGVKVKNIKFRLKSKHVLSHQIINARFYDIEVNSINDLKYLKIKAKDIEDYPVSRLILKYWEV